MENCNLIIFDCDGVLVDSEVIAARNAIKEFAEHGIQITFEDYVTRYPGQPFSETVKEIQSEYDVNLPADFVERTKDTLMESLSTELQPIKDVKEAVQFAASLAEICIGSSSTPERLEAMLNKTGLVPLFNDNVFSVIDTRAQRPKPAPDIFLYAAREMNVKPQFTFVVEDSVHGVEAAKTAGMRIIGFTGGAHSWPGHAEALSNAGAEIVIASWADFKSVWRIS